MNAVVMIDGLYITPRLDLSLRGVLVLDQKTDTLFNASSIFMDMKSFKFNQAQKFFAVNDISVSDASFTLFKGRHDSVFSYDFIRDHFQSESPPDASDTVQKDSDWRVSLGGLDLQNVHFRFIDENKERKPIGMDYHNLDIFVTYLRMDDLKIHNDTFDFFIEKLKARDRCGFVLDHMQGDFKLSPLFLIVDSLKIITPNSDIKLDLAFKYNGWPSYILFTEEVDMTSDIKPSEINMKDIGYFAPNLLVMENPLRIGGKVKGRVNNLRVKDFRLTYGNDTRFYGDVRLYGLPDVVETYIHTNIKELTLTSLDIESFAIPGSRRYITVPEELEAFGKMIVKGSFTGFYNDFVSTADFTSDIGKITTDVSLQQNEEHTDVEYNGKVHAQNFDLGRLLELEEYLGKLDLDVMVNGSGLSSSTAEINITGNVDSLEFMGNTFNQLDIRGEFAESKFNGILDVQDEMINLNFNGILDFEPQKPIFNFTAEIVDADLYRLNLLDRDTISILDVKLNCNFIGFDLEDLEGRILFDSLNYLEGEKKWFLEHFAFNSIKDTGYYKRVTITSDILDANINGQFSYGDIPYAVDEMLQDELMEWSFMLDREIPVRRQELDFDLRVKETEALTDIFVPGLFVQPESKISGRFDSETRLIELDAKVPYISYIGIQSDSIHLAVNSIQQELLLTLNTERILLKEKDFNDTLQLGFEAFNIDCKLNNDSLNFGVAWDDQDKFNHNMADIRGHFTYLDSTHSELRITKSDVIINDSSWNINEDNQMVFGPDYYNFHKLEFVGNEQKLAINGIISRESKDTLSIDFKDWRLSNFDIIFSNYNFDLNGVTNGYFGINNLYKSPNFFSNLVVRDLEMNDVLIGDADIKSSWDKDRSAIDIVSQIIHHGNVADSRVVILQGSYFPERSRNNLDFELELENLRLEILERFAVKYISELRGVSTGKFRITGSTSEPNIQGQLKLMRTECRVNYLNAKFSLAHTIDFKTGLIDFEDLIILDTAGNQAVANGRITHRHLKDIFFDINVLATDFACLNVNRYQNDVFYGRGVVSGNTRFYGPVDDFHIDANVVSAKGSDITIPLNNSITITENDFVVFLQDEEQEDGALTKDYSVNLKGLSLDFNIEITNLAELMIYLPSNMGNISSTGFGDIRFTIDPRGEFEIFGTYNFLRGSFFFSLQSMINRRFEILQGGNLTFTGNPYNADVNLKALYKLKTNLSGLGANISPEYEGQRVNVNAYLGLKGKLANPEINFSIDFPNVKDEVRQTIYAILDTNDAALMNQQMISLLLMNSFSYASGNTSMSSSSFNIISGQLSNLLSQISNDFDIGINYRAGDEINQEEVEVALSTQFFDNRLIVDGNVGVITKDKTQQQASNIVGDVNIEYKLTPDGRIRLRAFNRSNNFNTIDYYAPYTQGVGVFYTKEFNRFKDAFKRQRRKKGESLEE